MKIYTLHIFVALFPIPITSLLASTHDTHTHALSTSKPSLPRRPALDNLCDALCETKPTTLASVLQASHTSKHSAHNLHQPPTTNPQINPDASAPKNDWSEIESFDD